MFRKRGPSVFKSGSSRTGDFRRTIAMCCTSSEDRCRFAEILFFRIAMFSSFHNCLVFVTVFLPFLYECLAFIFSQECSFWLDGFKDIFFFMWQNTHIYKYSGYYMSMSKFSYCVTFSVIFSYSVMSTKVTCNTCNKPVNCRNLIKYLLWLTMFHLKCSN